MSNKRSPRPTFLIVQSDAVVTRSLTRTLSRFGPVRSASKLRGGLALLRQVEQLMAAVIALDLPDGDGLDLVERLRGVDDVAPVLVLSESYEHALINRTQLLGAQYLRMPVQDDNVIAFVRRAIDQRGGPDSVLAMLLFDLAESQRLSDRERELVSLVACGESLATVPTLMGVSANTVKTITRRVLRKCDAPNLETLVRPLRRIALGIPERSVQDS